MTGGEVSSIILIGFFLHGRVAIFFFTWVAQNVKITYSVLKNGKKKKQIKTKQNEEK